MKRCPFCAEEIQDAAIVCKHCKRDLDPKAAVRRVAPTPITVPAPRKTSAVRILGGVLIGLFFVGWCALRIPPTPGTPQRASTASVTSVAAIPRTEQLALLTSTGHHEYDYWIVEGQVQSLADAPLKNVTAVATWYTAEGTFVSSSDALIDFNPLMPGQSSPFKTMTRGNPLMSKYTVQFKSFMGGTIRTRDDRK